MRPTELWKFYLESIVEWIKTIKREKKMLEWIMKESVINSNKFWGKWMCEYEPWEIDLLNNK